MKAAAVTLSPVLVMGIVLAIAVWRDAKRGWVATFGVMFGISIAGGPLAGPAWSGINAITRLAAAATGVAQEELGGGSGPASGGGTPTADPSAGAKGTGDPLAGAKGAAPVNPDR